MIWIYDWCFVLMRIGIVNCFCFNDHGGMQVVTSSIIHIHIL